MKYILILLFLVIYNNVFSQTPKSDSLRIINAKKEWVSPYNLFSYQPWIREERTIKYLEKISSDSPFYQDRLELEKEMKEYFETWQPIVDERYDFYVNKISGIKNYRSLLRRLVQYGFKQEKFFSKDGNLFYDYSLLEYDGFIKILVQIKINYASDVSYDVFTYCY
ncbi:MAG: hypothetical protein WAT71_18010 [Ignavibacteria bacterium]